jgi:hypothetical protein
MTDVKIDQDLIIAYFQQPPNKIFWIPTDASQSVGFKININTKDLFGKAYFWDALSFPNNEDCTDIASLDYERRVYSEIIADMSNGCPNFVQYAGSSFINKTNTVGYATLSGALEAKKDKHGNLCPLDMNKGIMVFFTEFIPNPKKFKEYEDTPEFSDIGLQVILSLLFMKQAGLQHNDLHTNNIMIEPLPQSTSLVYNLPNGENYTLENITMRVCMFDWDFAYSTQLGPNPKIVKYFENVGIQNEFDERFDIFTFLCMVMEVSKDDNFNQAVLSIIPDINEMRKDIDDAPKWKSFFCRLMNDPSFRDLVPSRVLERLIRTPYFQSVIGVNIPPLPPETLQEYYAVYYDYVWNMVPEIPQVNSPVRKAREYIGQTMYKTVQEMINPPWMEEYFDEDLS